MPKSLFDRAKEALGCKTNKELAQKLGQAESGVSSWKQRDFIPLEHLMKIVEISGASLDWLVYGHDSLNSESGNYLPVYDNNEFVSVPLFDVAASAGNGCFFGDENVLQLMHFNKDWVSREGLHSKDLACLSIKGDSMSPALQDTDIVLINRAKTNGDGIFVIRIGEALRIKRLQWLTTG